jgi:hypothetical protein
VFPVYLIHAKAIRLGLEYLIIGGHVVNIDCAPRLTLAETRKSKDWLDIENLARAARQDPPGPELREIFDRQGTPEIMLNS